MERAAHFRRGQGRGDHRSPLVGGLVKIAQDIRLTSVIAVAPEPSRPLPIGATISGSMGSCSQTKPATSHRGYSFRLYHRLIPDQASH